MILINIHLIHILEINHLFGRSRSNVIDWLIDRIYVASSRWSINLFKGDYATCQQHGAIGYTFCTQDSRLQVQLLSQRISLSWLMLISCARLHLINQKYWEIKGTEWTMEKYYKWIIAWAVWDVCESLLVCGVSLSSAHTLTRMCNHP